jgi:hypothetical protein
MANTYEPMNPRNPLPLLAQLRAIDATIDEQHDAGAPRFRLTKATPWQPAEITAVEAVLETPELPLLRYTRTSHDKDLLATFALIVRARGIPAWNAMTLPQKVAATLAEADTWITIRDFLEANA